MTQKRYTKADFEWMPEGKSWDGTVSVDAGFIDGFLWIRVPLVDLPPQLVPRAVALKAIGHAMQEAYDHGRFSNLMGRTHTALDFDRILTTAEREHQRRQEEGK